MKNIFLIGDSIRQGYDSIVRDMMADRAQIYWSDDNARFIQYTQRYVHEWAGMLFGIPVAKPEQARQVPVNTDESVGNKAGCTGGNETERIFHLAVDVPALKCFLHSLAAGVMTFSGIAAQYQHAHDGYLFSVFLKRRSSRGRL